MDDPRAIQIGKRAFEVNFSDCYDDVNYYLEVYGNGKFDYADSFTLTDLTGVYTEVFPDNFQIIIILATHHPQKINFVELKKFNDILTLKVVLAIAYANWELPESISSFSDRYAEIISSKLGCDALAVREELEYFIECTFEVPKKTELYGFYTNIENNLEKLYRRSLLPVDNNIYTDKAYGNGRFHWWVRYVIVPIIGSGAIAAVIAKYLLK